MHDVALGATDGAPVHAILPEPPGPAEPVAERRRSPEDAEQLVLDLITAHADSLLRMARRYSVCADDAQDAYQRGLEILIRHSGRLDADRAGGWLHTVVKHEALAINRARRQLVGGEEVDLDTFEMRTAPSPEEQVIGFERVARSAEALQRLKPQEVRALWLKSMGNSYQEICETTGWTYTKVNRCLAEGRKSFLARYAGIESGEECKRWAPVISAMVDGEATSEQLMELRPHLRNCAGCRAAVRELRGSNAPLVALFPVGLAMGGGALGGAGDFLERLWHSLWGGLSDRAVGSAHRAQSIVEAVAGGRAAATAASVAALAGGSVAVERAVTSGAPAPPPVAAAAAPVSGSGGAASAATSAGSGGGASAATVKFAATRIKQASTRAASRRATAPKARRTKARTIVRRPATRRVAPAPAPATRTAPLVPASTAAGAAPASAASVATRAAAPSPARAAAPAPRVGSTSRGAGGSGTEFSLERP